MNPLCPPASRQQGFTLLEVLIALMLLSLMLGILFSGLRFGARSWDAGEQHVQATADHSLVLDFLRRQLIQARPLRWETGERPDDVAFDGERERLRFVAPLPAYRGQGGLYLFTLEWTEAGPGQLQVAYRVFLPQALEKEGEGVERQELLLEGVEALHLAYFGAEDDVTDPKASLRWQDSWRERRRLPRLIRLRLQTQDDRSWPELVVAPYLAETDPDQARGGGTQYKSPGLF